MEYLARSHAMMTFAMDRLASSFVQQAFVSCRDIRQARTTEREKAKDSEKERARQIRADLEPTESDDEDYWVRHPYSSR